MIYGPNFNRTPIPPEIKKRFAHVQRISCRSCGGLGYYRATTADGEEETEPCHGCARRSGRVPAQLQGVCESAREMLLMRSRVDDARLVIHVTTRRIGHNTWYGIYCY
jgi:hypothetical protein